MEIKVNSSYLQGDNTVMSGIMSSVYGDICHFTFVVPGDKTNVSESEKVKVLLDKVYNSLYPNRAEKEAIANIKSEINILKDEALKEIKDETEKNRVMVRAVSQIVNQYLMLHAEELEDEEDDIGNNDDDERSEEENREETEGENSNDN